MPPETLVPQSAAIQAFAFAFGLCAGAVIFSALAYGWGRVHGWRAGFAKGDAAGWVAGFQEAGVLERLVALDEISVASQTIGQEQERREALMRRYEGAEAEWQREHRS